MRRRGPTIAALQLGDTLRLQSAIATAITCNAGGDREAAKPRERDFDLIRLTTGKQNLIVSVVPAAAPAGESIATAAVLFALRTGGEADTMVAPVCRSFGLSSVETRLACHIVAGRSLQEACHAMRVKEQTARSYLKQIFLKTAVNRQADLVRVLLSNLVRARVLNAGLHC